MGREGRTPGAGGGRGVRGRGTGVREESESRRRNGYLMRFENPHYAVPCTRGAVGALSMSLENRELAVTDKSVRLSHQIYFKKCYLVCRSC